MLGMSELVPEWLGTASAVEWERTLPRSAWAAFLRGSRRGHKDLSSLQGRRTRKSAAILSFADCSRRRGRPTRSLIRVRRHQPAIGIGVVAVVRIIQSAYRILPIRREAPGILRIRATPVLSPWKVGPAEKYIRPSPAGPSLPAAGCRNIDRSSTPDARTESPVLVSLDGATV